MIIPRVVIPGALKPVVTPRIFKPFVCAPTNNVFTVARPTTFKSSKSFGAPDMAVSIVVLVVASKVAIFFNCLALLTISLAPTENEVAVRIPDMKAPCSFNI